MLDYFKSLGFYFFAVPTSPHRQHVLKLMCIATGQYMTHPQWNRQLVLRADDDEADDGDDEDGHFAPV